jgi:hypothetical protein
MFSVLLCTGLALHALRLHAAIQYMAKQSMLAAGHLKLAYSEHAATKCTYVHVTCTPVLERD